MFNVGRATHWSFADGLGVNPKAHPETIGLAILTLRQVASPSLSQGTPRGIIDKELEGHCTHDGFYTHQVLLAYTVVFSQRRAFITALRSEVRRSTDWATTALRTR